MEFWSHDQSVDPLIITKHESTLIVKYNINQTKSGQQLCSMNALFDFIERSPKLSLTKSILIVEERIVKRPTCFALNLMKNKTFDLMIKVSTSWPPEKFKVQSHEFRLTKPNLTCPNLT